MFTEDYVSFETAKLLKEKGYCNISNTLYNENGEFIRYDVGLNNKGYSCILGEFYECPTIQMAMKWLRENYVMHIDVRVTNHSISDLIDIVKYYWVVYNSKTARWVNESTIYKVQCFDTYEEACDDAIRTCLKNIK